MAALGALRRTTYAVPVLAALCVSCASVPAPEVRDDEAPELRAEIVMQALALVGVPYRFGGDDPAQGLDCSGLVRHVYRSAVGVQLPRRSEDIGRVGRRIARADVRAGDLLFFNTLGRPNTHVAVYVGDGRFVHAPTRRGHVRVEALDERYWRTRFNGARRIDLPGAQETDASQRATAPARSDESAHEQ